MYRNRKITDEAQHHSCQFCDSHHGVVAAHSNQLKHGKGKGIKAHDCFVAFICHSCHTYVDSSKGSIERRTAVWQLAHEKTIPLIWNMLNEEGRRLLAEIA